MDIPNAFIQTCIKDDKDMTFIKIWGVLVDILLEIEPDVYGPNVITDRKVIKKLPVQFQGTIYGKMIASLLYYKKFRNIIEDEGYVLNPYYPCVANKIIKVSQMTVCFHVDDYKLSHNIPNVVGKTITWIQEEYESIFEDRSGEITVHRGKVHNYLGMTLHYTEGGNVKVSMIYYIDEIIASFDKAEPRGCGIKTSPTPEDLYKADKECEKLSPEKAKIFHNILANTL